jgi:hypothetical protein
MPRYRVIVTRDTTESAWIIVDAASPEEADEAALEQARDGDVRWDPDEGNELRPYIGDPEGCELLPSVAAGTTYAEEE